MLPIWDTHPVGFLNPVNLRVSAILIAAPNWDATPVEQSVAGAETVTLACTYTQAAANGAFDWYLQYSLYAVAANIPTGAAEWSTESLYASGAVVAGVDTGSRVQREFQTYQATSANEESIIYGPIPLGAIERIRLYARESGVPGTPGNLQVTAELK